LWRVYPDGGCYETRWPTGVWSTQAKVEGIVPWAAWHWGRHCSDVNDSLGEPGRTPLYVGLPSARAPWMVTLCFYCMYEGGLLFGDSGRHTGMNK
jgi:hypothetical protein